MNKNAIEHLSKDAYLKKVIETTNLETLPLDKDVYKNLIKSIVSQQLSVKAASTIYNRFLGLFKDQYPESDYIITMDVETLRSVGLSRQKASYIQNVAYFFKSEKLLEKNWAKFSNDDIIKNLTQIKGVGKWTVQMILMFTLQRPDIFPIDDLGIQNAMIRLYNLEGKYSKSSIDQKNLRQELHLIAENWSPNRTIACRYLWKYLHQ
jgi:DNA-3-methyladenine glycosylase II